MDLFDKINELHEKRKLVKLGGGIESIQRQHKKGKKTARERIHYLLDEGTFIELNPFIKPGTTDDGMKQDTNRGEGVVTGYGEINRKPVFLFAQDFTIVGGTLGAMHANKIAKVMDLAAKSGVPFIGLNDSGGARIQEGVSSLDGYGKIFYRNTMYSGVIPQISVMMGPNAGGAVYSPALTDIVIMVEKTSQMFITGPQVIASVMGEQFSAEELGGASIHCSISGNAHLSAKSEEEALDLVKKLLSYLPANYKVHPTIHTIIDKDHHRPELVHIVPYDSTRPYDMKKVIHQIVDEDSFFEIHQQFAKNIIVGFARVNGRVVGLVCNQPKHLAGSLDIDSSDKTARFIRFCDSFNIPLITCVDVPGFFPGIHQEHRGIIRHGAKILYAYAEATVPKITVIIRKAFGGAYVALNSKAIGADIVYAWPNAEVSVMGPEGAVNIMFAREIAHSHDSDQLRQKKIDLYREKFANPYISAELGMIDDIIDPRETRLKIIGALNMLKNKKEKCPEKKHGNIPL